MQCTKTVTLPCLFLESLPFAQFYTLNLFRNITLKLQAITTQICVGIYISLKRSAIHMNHYSVLPSFGVTFEMYNNNNNNNNNIFISRR